MKGQTLEYLSVLTIYSPTKEENIKGSKEMETLCIHANFIHLYYLLGKKWLYFPYDTDGLSCSYQTEHSVQVIERTKIHVQNLTLWMTLTH